MDLKLQKTLLLKITITIFIKYKCNSKFRMVLNSYVVVSPFSLKEFPREHFKAKKFYNITNVNLRSIALIFISSFNHKCELLRHREKFLK